jgi:CO/xanthine dehydrogenase Mo-binding subunit
MRVFGSRISFRSTQRSNKVRVIADHVGGGFGSKGTLGMETIAAIELARAANAPVRVAYDREEELSVTGYRPAAALYEARETDALTGHVLSSSMEDYRREGIRNLRFAA